MEVKKEKEDPYIEEQKQTINDHFIPNVIVNDIFNSKKDNTQIRCVVKKELVLVKQENPDDLGLEVHQESHLTSEKETMALDIVWNTNVKQELNEEANTLNVHNDLMGKINSPIKQEANDIIFEGCSSSIQQECNISANKFKHLKDKLGKQSKLRGQSFNGRNMKEQDPFTSIIICPDCGNVYAKKAEFSYHILAKHFIKRKRSFKTQLNNQNKVNNTNILTCLNRGVTTINENKLKDVDDKMKNLFKSDICLKSFSRKGSFKKHKHSHSGEKPFKCVICWESFAQRSNLYAHFRCHTGEKPYKCEICLKPFMHKGDLNTHFRCHTLEKPFKCNICMKSFSWRANLNKHKRCHTGEKPFKCDLCSNLFSRKGNLTKHLCLHSGEKPFQCNACSKSFLQKAHLNRHLNTHTGETTFNCVICLKTFDHKCDLTKHLLCHTEYGPFKCDVCVKSFSLKASLKKHMRSHTVEKPFECDFCSKHFAKNYVLKNHLRTHFKKKPFDCDVCFESFSEKSYFITHARCHKGEKPFQCDLCFETFPRKTDVCHSLPYSQKTPFKCDICSETFYTQEYLNNDVLKTI